jgi:hypothetical protein
MPKFFLFFLMILVSFQLFAQSDSDAIIPPVTKSDFSLVSPLIDSETGAVILIDSGASAIDGNSQDGFFLRYYQFRRMLILKTNILDEVVLHSVRYSVGMNGRYLKSLKAFTYNLEDGKIVKSEISENEFYVESTKSDIKTIKFTFPRVKEGSIIEYEYSKKINTYDLENWYFQGEYPKLKSVYTVTVPNIFNYSIRFQNKKFLTNTRMDTVIKTISSTKHEYQNTLFHTISWTYENVPSMIKEDFTSTIDNYLACVKFQLSAVPYAPGDTRGLLNNWDWFSDNMLNRKDFGKIIEDPGSMMKKQAKIFAGEENNELYKAIRIFSGVRDHFKVKGYGIFFSENQTLNDIYKAGTASVIEINFVLIAMLRSQKISADPVILGTRDNGLTNQKYPIVDNYNYVVCRAVINGKEYFLDASSPFMAFGRLPIECYNGHARVITENNFPVFLAPDSLKESRMIVANIYNDSKSKYLDLELTQHAGFYESCEIRDELKSKSLHDVLRDETKSVPFSKSLDSVSSTDLTNMELPLVLSYKMRLDPAIGQRIYFNPLLNYGMTENPFKSLTRSYPVEMPYVLEKAFVLHMEIPAGYEIEELPKSQKYLLNDSGGIYEYRVDVDGNTIQVRSTMTLFKAIFEPEDYNFLRDFYAAIIKKENELIVFKKKT